MQKTFSFGRTARTVGALFVLVLSSTVASQQSASAAAPGLQNQKSGICLGISGGGSANGTPAIQWECNHNSDQAWDFVQSGDGIELVNANHMCLEAPGWTTAPGAQLGQWTCHGGANQIWYTSGSDTGPIHLINKNSNMCISDRGGSMSWGNPIIQWPCSDVADQLWNVS
ncbi:MULTISPECIES: RICIN domain-containing protein [Kitasatospora]|uniref:Ricin B lectin domain-containing protein n=1 Tax=Kitasatospora cystarginea TaxID=58350 RepID=A0ABP5RNE5_9ACTN